MRKCISSIALLAFFFGACGSVDPSAFDPSDDLDASPGPRADVGAETHTHEGGSDAPAPKDAAHSIDGGADSATEDTLAPAPADVAPADTETEDTREDDTLVVDPGVPDTGSAVDTTPTCGAPVLCAPDADGDGFPAAGVSEPACETCPSGAIRVDSTTPRDCDDVDSAVHPGASAFMTTPYCVPGTSCAVKSFDYDCDGVEQAEWKTIAGSCLVAGPACAGDGWSATEPPPCGASASWLTCARVLLLCSGSTTARTQACR